MSQEKQPTTPVWKCSIKNLNGNEYTVHIDGEALTQNI